MPCPMPRLVAGICLILALLAASPAIAEDRLALVIGNAGYRNVPALDNPANDARLMARTLRAKGFRVAMVVDADVAEMRRAVERFGDDLRAAPPGALGLFYYAGHGVRSNGFNYLLPLDVDIRSEADIAREAVAAEWVLERMEAPGATKLMVLDACRNNPFDDRGDGTVPALGDGLARMTPRADSLIAYATGPGDVALDGTGENSPYTAALARAIRTPGLDIEEVFARVRQTVETATAGAQIPWERSSLDAAIYMRAEEADTATATPPDAPARSSLLSVAVAFRPGRLGWGAGCSTIYRYGPVTLPVEPGDAHRLRAIDAGRPVPLELSASRDAGGTVLSIVPVSGARSGRAVTVRLAEITPGDQHALYTGVRHPDLFGCGTMIVYLGRDR